MRRACREQMACEQVRTASFAQPAAESVAMRATLISRTDSFVAAGGASFRLDRPRTTLADRLVVSSCPVTNGGWELPLDIAPSRRCRPARIEPWSSAAAARSVSSQVCARRFRSAASTISHGRCTSQPVTPPTAAAATSNHVIPVSPLLRSDRE